MYKQFWLWYCLIGGASLFAQLDSLEEWIQKLKHPSWQIREEATQELLMLGESARKPLEEALKKATDPEVRWRLQSILQFFEITIISEQEEEILLLIQNLYDRNPRVVYSASQSLQKIGSECLPYLQQELKQATNYQDRTRLKDLIEIISNQVKDSENTSSDPLEKEFQKYMANLKDQKKHYIGVTLIKAMGESALPFLIQEIKKPSEQYKVRIALVQLIGSIRQKESVDCLVQLMETETDSQVSTYAHMYLRKMTGQTSISQIRWKEWWEKNRENFRFPPN